MKRLYLISVIALVLLLTACTKQPKATEETPLQDTLQEVVEAVDDEKEADVIVEQVVTPEPVAAKPAPKKQTTAHSTATHSSSSSSSYSSYNDDETETDYWDEFRKHSPNDNYLLGFDEDVDDVHDMELYIEDY